MHATEMEQHNHFAPDPSSFMSCGVSSKYHCKGEHSDGMLQDVVGLLLDVGPSMANLDDEGMSHLEKAKGIISMFLQRKVCTVQQIKADTAPNSISAFQCHLFNLLINRNISVMWDYFVRYSAPQQIAYVCLRMDHKTQLMSWPPVQTIKISVWTET